MDGAERSRPVTTARQAKIVEMMYYVVREIDISKEDDDGTMYMTELGAENQP